MAKLSVTTEEIVEAIIGHYNTVEVSTQDVRNWASAVGYSPSTILNRLSDYKSGRGKFNLDVAQVVTQLEDTYQAPAAECVKTCVSHVENLVPTKDDKFVPFGNFKDVKDILKSEIFYPMFITGLSGNGKTYGTEQACAQLGRELIRVNITIETDEDDLIGGFRLIDGETVWSDGPVVEALKRGAVLLLDEVDLASNKIMCLQSLLEGNGVFIKKTSTYVRPAKGFNVVATANTKGKGCEGGMFIGTNVLNEAFLERFAVTFEQKYPTPATEAKILTRLFASLGNHVPDKIVEDLTNWSDIIRKTYYDGGIEDVISTRRLINICKAYTIWDSMDKAMELCTNRFDTDTQKVFRELYDKISGVDVVS